MNNESAFIGLIRKFQETGDNDAFSEICIQVLPRHTLSKRVTRLSQRYKLDEQDVESVVYEKLFEIVQKFNSPVCEFEKHLNTAIKFGCIDLLRKDMNIPEMPESFLSDEENANFFDTIMREREPSAEEFAVECIQKSHDQRQLIVALLSSADEMTRQSLSAFAECDSYNAAAKLLGVTDKTVKKKIRKLSRSYDGNRFGDYHDFFTVATAVV